MSPANDLELFPDPVNIEFGSLAQVVSFIIKNLRNKLSDGQCIAYARTAYYGGVFVSSRVSILYLSVVSDTTDVAGY